MTETKHPLIVATLLFAFTGCATNCPPGQVAVESEKGGCDWCMTPEPPLPPSQHFNIGDVVRFKTGGPAMQVMAGGDYTIWVDCQWFDSLGHAQRESFKAETLELVPKTGEKK